MIDTLIRIVGDTWNSNREIAAQRRLEQERYDNELNLMRIRADLDQALSDGADRRLQQVQDHLDHQQAILLDAARRPSADSYPFRQGEGSIQADLRLAGGGRPLVILVPPKPREGQKDLWSGLADMTKNEVTPAINDLCFIRVADGWFDWPNDRLYANDLRGQPTIIVHIAEVVEGVTIQLGGCHINPDEAITLPRRVARIELVDSEAAANLSTTPKQFFYLGIQKQGGAESAVKKRIIEAISTTVVASLDLYNLLNTLAYRERMLELANDPQFGHITEAVLEYELVPQDRMADPTFHLLSRAEVAASTGDQRLAGTLVRAAIDSLAGSDADGTHEEIERAAFRSTRYSIDHHRLLDPLNRELEIVDFVPEPTSGHKPPAAELPKSRSRERGTRRSLDQDYDVAGPDRQPNSSRLPGDE